MDTLVLASTNPGKIADFRSLLTPLKIQLISQQELSIPDVPETGSTFIENALIKARHAATHTNYPTLADDSGLIIDDLKGAPGLYSARFAGHKATPEQNIEKVLQELKLNPASARRARLYAVVVLLRSPTDPTPVIGEGFWEGTILHKPTGHGFGYLPIFFSTLHQRPATTLSIEERNQTNHRGQAMRQLLDKLLKSHD